MSPIRFVFLLLVAGIAVERVPARAQDAIPKCATYASTILGREVKYCVERSRPDLQPARGEPVVYFMHGTNGGAVTWVKNNYNHSLAVLRDSRTLEPVTFVSFDTSAYSFFTDHPVAQGKRDTSRAFETWFVEEFVPYIEKSLGVCDRRECRGIMGESMGGFGAIKTALRHPSLFAAVSVNSPALSPFEYKKPFADWVSYFSGKPIGPLKGFLLTRIIFEIFPDEQVFDANNPAYLVKNYSATEPFPSFYFDMGGKDDYGFYDGYGLFKNALDQRGFAYKTLFEASGKHDMWKRHATDALLFLEEHLRQDPN